MKKYHYLVYYSAETGFNRFTEANYMTVSAQPMRIDDIDLLMVDISNKHGYSKNKILFKNVMLLGIEES